MCTLKNNLTLFSRWYDYWLTEWSGMIQLTPFYGGQDGYFFKVTDTIYCLQGGLV